MDLHFHAPDPVAHKMALLREAAYAMVNARYGEWEPTRDLYVAAHEFAKALKEHGMDDMFQRVDAE